MIGIRSELIIEGQNLSAIRSDNNPTLVPAKEKRIFKLERALTGFLIPPRYPAIRIAKRNTGFISAEDKYFSPVLYNRIFP